MALAIMGTDMTEQHIPYSEEAELAVLSSMLLSERCQIIASEMLHPAMFYRHQNRIIFRAIQNLYEKDLDVDAVTLADELKSSSLLDDVGGYIYLSKIIDATPSEVNIENYCRIVNEKYTARTLIDSAREIIDRGLRHETGKTDELLDFAEGKIFNISKTTRTDSIVKLSDLVDETFDLIRERVERDSNVVGLPSGLPSLDNITAGFRNSNLSILAGRPSMGKTALALNIAQNAAIRHGVGTLYFSLEMSRTELIERVLASEAQVNGRHLQIGQLSTSEKRRVKEAADILKESPLFVDDSSYVTPIELRSKARRLSREQNIGLVIVDYMQLMHVNEHAGTREQEISTISRSLKGLAKDLNVPVLALSQLSRSCEQRENKRPILSDLRESGAIEQDADLVIFVFREEHYTGPYNREGEDVQNIAELIVSKQRNGPTGSVDVTFNKPYATFEDL